MLRCKSRLDDLPNAFEDSRGSRKYRKRNDSYDTDAAALEESVFGRQPFVEKSTSYNVSIDLFMDNGSISLCAVLGMFN